MIVSGVRSSCETSSRNWRWLALAASTWLCACSRAASISSIVRATLPISSFGPGVGQSLAVVLAGGDGGRRGAHPVERADGAPDQQPAGQPGQQQGQPGGRVEDAAQPAERLVDHRRRPADDDVAGQPPVEHDRLLVEDQRDLADRELVLELTGRRRLERQVPLAEVARARDQVALRVDDLAIDVELAEHVDRPGAGRRLLRGPGEDGRADGRDQLAGPLVDVAMELGQEAVAGQLRGGQAQGDDRPRRGSA